MANYTVTTTNNTKLFHGYTAGEWRNDFAFAMIKNNGSVVTWGASSFGGDSSAVASQLNGTVDVTQIYSTGSGFAALRADSSVVTWGYSDSSAVASQLDGSMDVTQIYSNSAAFAALRADGSVVTWGDDTSGGDSAVYHHDYKTGNYVKDYSIASQLDGTVDVTQIYSGVSAFAALRSDGSVVTWGNSVVGGDSSAVASQLDGTVGVSQIYTTGDAFAALRTDGSVITWGNSFDGGDSSAVANQLNGTVGVTQIYSNEVAFAALRTDGSVVTWSNNPFAGDSSAVTDQLNGTVDAIQIYSNELAFAALRTDGSVVTWGWGAAGGDSSAVASQLDGTIDVTQIYSTRGAFAALRTDGSVVTWGYSSYGGDSSAVASQLNGTVDVTQIYSTQLDDADPSSGSAFAALRADGSVVTWGNSSAGGNSSWVARQLDGTVDVIQIYSTSKAFAALRADGSVVTWGDSSAGGDSAVYRYDSSTHSIIEESVASQLNGTVDVTQIYATGSAFAALRADGSVVTWGNSYHGGDSSAVAWQLTSGVVSGANIYTNDVFSSDNYAPTGDVTVSDTTPEVNQTLTASNTLADADGLGDISYSWLVNNLLVATADSYVVSDTDVGKVISVVANYTDLLGISESVSSVATQKAITFANLNLIGTADPDLLNGSSGNDVLNGRAGKDVLNGGAGKDKIYGGAGADIENGGDGHDVLWGISGNNTLDGGMGNDRLIAGKGYNVLTGGDGKDSFRFNSASHSTITDFVAADDTIKLENKFFTQLTTTGALAEVNFVIGTAAVEADDFIVYDNTTGALFYDADGSGAGAAVQIALIGATTHAALTASDFVVV